MGRRLGKGAICSVRCAFCKPWIFSAVSLPLWRAVIRWSDLKAFRAEEEPWPPGAASAPGPASVQPCTFLKMQTLEWPVLASG